MVNKPSKAVVRAVFALTVVVGLALTVSVTARSEDGSGAGIDGDCDPNCVTYGTNVTVYQLAAGITNYGGDGAGNVGYSVSTDSCNVGSEPLEWISGGGGGQHNQHPVIGQNLYRLKGGRFEQIGKSWLKHGFLSLNSTRSGCVGQDPAPGADPGDEVSCISPPGGGAQLGIGCTDLYGSGLNGSRPLGQRVVVDSTAGTHAGNQTSGGSDDNVKQRLRVAEADVDSSQNAGALYWVEGHYITQDDAEYQNGANAFNNASHREVVFGGTPNFNMSTVDVTMREEPAIYAWPKIDPTVQVVPVDFSTGGGPLERFNAALKVTTPARGGSWHYEVVIHNLNSERKADALRVDFPAGTTFSNTYFRDVDWHSGDETDIDITDWTVTTGGGQIRFAAPAPMGGLDTNALSWSTSFTFAFDATSPPTNASWNIELFEPGTPSEVNIRFDPPVISTIFADGFESGNVSSWSGSVP